MRGKKNKKVNINFCLLTISKYKKKHKIGLLPLKNSFTQNWKNTIYSKGEQKKQQLNKEGDSRVNVGIVYVVPWYKLYIFFFWKIIKCNGNVHTTKDETTRLRTVLLK